MHTQAEIITVMVTVMQEIKEQSTYYSVAAGRQAVTARRERDYWNTHTHTQSLPHTHTGTHKVRYVSQHRDVLCCNLFVYKIHLDGCYRSEREKERECYNDNTPYLPVFSLGSDCRIYFTFYTGVELLCFLKDRLGFFNRTLLLCIVKALLVVIMPRFHNG